MSYNGNDIFDGVEIPLEAVESSKSKKTKRERTLSQLPVFRQTSNLLLLVMEVTKNSPLSMRRYFDGLLADVKEIMKLIGFADNSRNPEERAWHIGNALVIVEVVKQEFLMLQMLKLIGKDKYNKTKSLMRSIVAQLIGWRDYALDKGVAKSVKKS